MTDPRDRDKDKEREEECSKKDYIGAPNSVICGNYLRIFDTSKDRKNGDRINRGKRLGKKN